MSQDGHNSLRNAREIHFVNKLRPLLVVSVSMCVCVCVCVYAHMLSGVRLCATQWSVPARLLCPWNFPGKNIGVHCHFLPTGSS